MLLQRLTDFILKNRLNAIGAVLLFSAIPLLDTIGILIVAFITLRRGALEGFILLIVSLMPQVIRFLVYPNFQSPLVVYVAEIFLIGNVLTWFFAVLLRKYNNWGFILQLALILGVIVIAMTHLIYPNVKNWWVTHLDTYFAKNTVFIERLKKEGISPSAQTEVVNIAAQYATGFLVASILFNVFTQLGIGRWWQAVVYNPRGLQKELHQLRLGIVAGIIFISAVILSFFRFDSAIDCLPMLSLIFCVAGLCLLHQLMSHKQNPWLWLMVIYLGVIWLFPLSIVVLSMVGLMDTFFDVRHRLGYKV